jgi:hypothetical protein
MKFRILSPVLVSSALGIATACSPSPDSHVEIRVDMSAEIQAGRFRPETGDHVLVAGGFDNWQGEGRVMEAGLESAVYAARLPVRGLDTLQFRFRISAGDGRALDGGGWEPLADRRHAVAALRSHQPVMRFGEVWGPKVEGLVTFRVNMANAHVLGFFDANDGDRIRLSGAFWNWEGGVDLEPEGEGLTYSTSVPLQTVEGVPIAYRYRIIRSQPERVTDPWDGWERNGARSRLADHMRTDFFNDQSHVVRVVVRSADGRAGGQVVELERMGARWRTEPLMRVAPGLYEAALVLTGVSGTIRWRLPAGAAEQWESGTFPLDEDGFLLRIDWP